MILYSSKVTIIRHFKLCESKESYFVGHKVKRMRTYCRNHQKEKYSVNIFVWVADAEYHQNFAPKLKVSKIARHNFLQIF
jgi:hypothetical protein